MRQDMYLFMVSSAIERAICNPSYRYYASMVLSSASEMEIVRESSQDEDTLLRGISIC